MLHKDIAKKGQGISLNVIIIAVIALLVLIVIVFIFTGKTRTFTKGVASCESKGGECEPGRSSCSGLGPLVGRAPDDVSCDGDNDGTPNEGASIDGDVCCLPLI